MTLSVIQSDKGQKKKHGCIPLSARTFFPPRGGRPRSSRVRQGQYHRLYLDGCDRGVGFQRPILMSTVKRKETDRIHQRPGDGGMDTGCGLSPSVFLWPKAEKNQWIFKTGTWVRTSLDYGRSRSHTRTNASLSSYFSRGKKGKENNKTEKCPCPGMDHLMIKPC